MALPPGAVNSPDDRDLLVGERSVLELIATGAELPVVLDALCNLIDEQSGLISSVYLLDGDGRQLRFAAGPRVQEAWRRVTQVFTATPNAGACGAAVQLRRAVVVDDVSSSPLYSPEWGAAAAAARIASLWSTPIFSKDGRVLGTFAVLDGLLRRPTGERLHLVERATRLASIIIEWHEAEVGLRESEGRFSTAFYSSPTSMAICRFADRRFMYVNDQFVAYFGYSRIEAIGKTSSELALWDQAPHDALWRTITDQGGVRGVEVQARRKSGTTMIVLLWLERIQILGEQCVLGIVCDITDRKNAERALIESERRARVVLDTLPVGVTVVDAGGNIVLTNPAAQRIWTEMIPSGPDRYARSRGWRHDTGAPIGPDDWPSARARLEGTTTVNDVIDIEAFDGTRKTVEISSAPIRDLDNRITGAVFTVDDVSIRKRAERELRDSLAQMRELSGRLMRAQDDERRRVAQMMHETAAQELAALKMMLAELSRRLALNGEDRSLLTETMELADRTMTGVRTLSYLLHPPLLDEVGLAPAIRWYAEGFEHRSGIRVHVDVPPFPRLPRDVETALFRVVQEALINVHRHAHSPSAQIRATIDGEIVLDIADEGRGIDPEVLTRLNRGGVPGVGLAGMRERLKQLDGRLDIASDAHGTRVRACVPLPPGGN